MVIPRIRALVIMFRPESLPRGEAEVYEQLADLQGDVSYFFGLSTVFD
jgi:hypothetical protein